MPIYTHSPSPGENFPQPDIGAVCPFSGNGAEKQRNRGYFALKTPSLSEKTANNSGRDRMNAIYSEVP